MMTAAVAENEDVLKTALWSLHCRSGARMVPFAGYDLPVQYEHGVKAEHLHVRENAGLFDVSHMGQIFITSQNDEDPAIALEKIVPSDIQNLAVGKMRYTVLLDENGGILDDLIVTRLADYKLFAVVNAACKEADIDYIRAQIGDAVRLTSLVDMSLIALQGPKAEAVLSKVLDEDFDNLAFMTSKYALFQGEELLVSRSGYTGEDGFEISISDTNAESFAEALLAEDGVWPIGLGARDSLRLESGFCLYGHDITPETTPIDASLNWVIPKARRNADAGFLGAKKIAKQIEEGTAQKRVGLRPEGRAPFREGVELFDETGETAIGKVTSGGYSPLLEGPIAMAYVATEYAKTGTKILAKMRGKDYPCEIVKMPFVTKDKAD